MNIWKAWKRVLGDAKESAMQSENDVRRRKLQEALINEYRQANDRARDELRETVPAMNARYVATMAQAMEIIKGH